MLDIGGGLGIRYADEAADGSGRFAAAVVPLLRRRATPCTSSPAGSWWAAPACSLTEVLYRKHSGGKEFVIVDAGMNDLVRPSHYQAYHEIVELEPSGPADVRADVVGPVCETGDFLALDRELPDVARGRSPGRARRRRLRLRHGVELQPRPRPPEVVVDGDRWWVARPREDGRAELYPASET